MGVGGYLSAQAERDHYRYLLKTTRVRHIPIERDPRTDLAPLLRNVFSALAPARWSARSPPSSPLSVSTSLSPAALPDLSSKSKLLSPSRLLTLPSSSSAYEPSPERLSSPVPPTRSERDCYRRRTRTRTTRALLRSCSSLARGSRRRRMRDSLSVPSLSVHLVRSFLPELYSSKLTTSLRRFYRRTRSPAPLLPHRLSSRRPLRLNRHHHRHPTHFRRRQDVPHRCGGRRAGVRLRVLLDPLRGWSCRCCVLWVSACPP